MAVSDHGTEGIPPSDAEARIGRLYREAAIEQPARHVDRTIATAVRENARQAARRSDVRLWRVAFAAAAVVVVSVSLVLLMRDRDSEHLATVSPQEAPAVSAPAAGASQAPPTEFSASIEESRASPAEALPQAPSRSARVDSRSGSTQPARSRAREARSVRPEEATASAPATAPVPTPVAPPAAEASAAAPDAATSSGERVRESVALLARPAPNIARHVAELEYQPPKAWMERVILLRRDRRTAEADALLAEFKRRYPLESIPADLP